MKGSQLFKQISFRIFWSEGSYSRWVREDIRGQLPGTLLPDLPFARPANEKRPLPNNQPLVQLLR